jgi:hypothetical protein
MTRARRKLSAFSLSFLDIMSCGFGAVVLLFLIIKHNVDANITQPVPTDDIASEIMLLEEEIADGRENLVRIRNTISDVDDQLAIAQGLARRIMEEIENQQGITEELIFNANEASLEQLKTEIKRLETERQQLLSELDETGENIRKFTGDGNRAYVTGLKLGGRHILVLLDVSGSMLDRTIVNILRIRNMRDELKRNAPKWRNAVATVDWLSARFPRESKYQIYLFNTRTTAALPDSFGQWLDVRDKLQLDQAIANLDTKVPEHGTNLEQAFKAASELKPLPDNIYLITDGLPTQGNKAIRDATVSGRERLNFFTSAVKQLPKNIPVNVILAPIEGDPEAANAFWQLARVTDGSFMSPTEDWP